MSCWNGYNENVMSKLMKDIRNLTKKPLEDIEICLDDSIYGGGLIYAKTTVYRQWSR